MELGFYNFLVHKVSVCKFLSICEKSKVSYGLFFTCRWLQAEKRNLLNILSVDVPARINLIKLNSVSVLDHFLSFVVYLFFLVI